jgi:ribonuclease P protein component
VHPGGRLPDQRQAVSGKTFSFPRCARLRASAEYQAVFGGGMRFSGTCFRLHAAPRAAAAAPSNPGAGPRLGITVSKRVDKTSVGRQRIKRQVRECFRRQRPGLPDLDLVVVAKAPAAAASNAELRGELEKLLQRVRALPPLDAAGTMPGLEAAGDGRIPNPSRPSRPS